jgi:Ca2+:H+ antiporter
VKGTTMRSGRAALALVGAVVAAVHHAEVVAHRVGEPFGTLVLAVAITVIEVALIVSMMLAGGPDKATLPRDTIYAAVMIICTGVVGICLLAGGLRHREQSFRVEGTGSALAALVALATLSLVLPTFTTSSPEGTYTDCAAGVRRGQRRWRCGRCSSSCRRCGTATTSCRAAARADEDVHAPPPTRAGLASFGLLLVALVVGGRVWPSCCRHDRGGGGRGGPEGGGRHRHRDAGAAARDLGRRARRPRQPAADQHEPGPRLGAGQHRADHPAVVVTATVLDLPLVLGLPPKDMVLLALTFWWARSRWAPAART